MSAKDRIQPSHAHPISDSLGENISELERIFTLTPDLVIRTFESSMLEGSAAIVYLTGLVDKNSINNNVLRPMLAQRDRGKAGILDLLSVGDVSIARDFRTVEKEIFDGSCVMFVEGRNEAFVLDTHGWPQRAIEDPQLEASLKGAHQGFVETGMQNIALIRRYLPNRELKIKEFWIGDRGATRVSILFLQDVAHPEVLQEMEDRIKQIKIDSILNTGIALLLGILLLWLYTPTFMDLLKWKQWWSTGGLLFGYALPVLAFVPIWLLRRSVKE